MKPVTNFAASRALMERARTLIPAGCHTYSKGYDQFPQNAPGFLVKGCGCHVWDVDGNEYVDWGMGLRSVILGYSYRPVLDAVMECLPLGPNFTRPSPVEVEVAERFVRLIPSAEMVKFAKNGSDVTSAGVRLARAYTGRDKVALCKENPFFSFCDWFIGTTPPSAGIPSAVQDLSVTFHYNDVASLQRLFDEHPNEIAAVILEPVSTEPPRDGFLEGVRRLTESHGAVLIFDEIISGCRWDLRGAQYYFSVTPDLSTFGKAIGNGFSVAALVGKREIMELGGLEHDKPKVFLLSATHGAEVHSLVATRVTLDELEAKQVVPQLWETGRKLQDGINAVAADLGLAGHVECAGYPCSPYVVCRDKDKKVSMPFRTLFLQETIARGILIPYIALSYSHTETDVAETLDAIAGALTVYRAALERGIEHRLVGPAVKPVFRRFN